MEKNTLRVDLGDFENNTTYAQYSTFSTGDNTTEYTLNVGEYSDTAGDALEGNGRNQQNNGMKFSTKDSNNNNCSGPCARDYVGAWWFYCSMKSHLNAHYHHGGSVTSWTGVLWYYWRGPSYSLMFTEIKVHHN